MYLSEHFGRAFWVDSNNEFRSCPLFVNNKPDFTQADYVSEWTDLEGVSLDKLLYIHRFELLLNEKFKNKVLNSLIIDSKNQNLVENRRPFSNGELFSLFILFIIISISLICSIFIASFTGKELDTIPIWLLK